MASVRQKFVAILIEAQESRKVISLYHQSHEADRFEVGFVENVSSSDVTMLCLTPRGEEDGNMSVRVEDIVALEIDDPYSNKIQLLHSYRGSVFTARDSAKGAGPSSIEAQLADAQDKRSVVSIEDVSGTRFTGFVEELESDYIQVTLLNQFGSPDGSAYLRRDMIQKVDVGRREEQTRAFLYRVNHGLKRLFD